MSSPKLITVNSADYHRNGVSGEGFYTGVVVVDGEDERGELMLVTVFPPIKNDDSGEVDFSAWWTHIAVLSLDRIPDHGVKFGANSWRGDVYNEVAKEMVRFAQEQAEREFQEALKDLRNQGKLADITTEDKDDQHRS